MCVNAHTHMHTHTVPHNMGQVTNPMVTNDGNSEELGLND